MVDWILLVLKETALGSFNLMKNLVIIIIPLMIFMQIMMDYQWLEKLSHKMKRVTEFLGMSKETLVPLLIGAFAGISYGAGAIVFAREKYNLSKDDVFLAMCFLSVFHGIIETTLIYWMIGVNPVLALTARICVAIPVTLFFKKRVEKRKSKEEARLRDAN